MEPSIEVIGIANDPGIVTPDTSERALAIAERGRSSSVQLDLKIEDHLGTGSIMRYHGLAHYLCHPSYMSSPGQLSMSGRARLTKITIKKYSSYMKYL